MLSLYAYSSVETRTGHARREREVAGDTGQPQYPATLVIQGAVCAYVPMKLYPTLGAWRREPVPVRPQVSQALGVPGIRVYTKQRKKPVNVTSSLQDPNQTLFRAGPMRRLELSGE